MIQDARLNAPRRVDTYEICSAKARVRDAARRPHGHAPGAPGGSLRDRAARTVAANPGAAAAVAFALVSVVGPVRLVRGGLMLAKFASVAAMGYRAMSAASDRDDTPWRR